MRGVPVLIGIVVTIAMVGAGSAGGLTHSGSVGVAVGVNTQSENQTVGPGKRLTGAVGVHGVELEGEVERRAVGIRFVRAASNQSKARVMKTTLDSIEARLDELERRNAQLEAARENGTISEGRYRAEVAQLAARTRTLEHLANDTDVRARALPPAVRARHGVDVGAIGALRRDARNVTGPGGAEIARFIAGPGVGNPVSAGQARPGPPGDRPPGPSTGSNGAGPGNGGPPDDRPGTGNSSTSPGSDGGPPGDGAGAAGNGSSGAGDNT